MKKIESFKLNKSLQIKEKAENVPPNGINEFFEFSIAYSQWKQKMGFAKLKTKEILKLLQENPWNQFKEEESVGLEPLKNVKTRKFWKRAHTLVKFRDAKLDDKGGYRLPQKNVDKEDD